MRRHSQTLTALTAFQLILVIYWSSHEDSRRRMMQVYRHHCIHQLSEEQRRLRDAAIYIEANADAVQWGLELEGYKDVRLVSLTLGHKCPPSYGPYPEKACILVCPFIIADLPMVTAISAWMKLQLLHLREVPSGSIEDHWRSSTTLWYCKRICSHHIAAISLT